jgi:acetyltransferase-like isoleucine patch superfamily enzyme
MYLVNKFYQYIMKKPPPYYAKYPLFVILWKPIRKFINVVVIPNIPFSTLRILLYRSIGFKIGRNVFIGMKCYLDDVEVSKTIIEDDVTISYGCYFACHGKGQKHTSIVIKQGAYIGMRCNILSGRDGVIIGKNAIIGAGSLVNKNVAKDAIAVGVPIKIKK